MSASRKDKNKNQADDQPPKDEAERTASEPEHPDLTEASLREQLEAALSERDANYDRWVRAQAELENYRKRIQKEAEQTRRYQALPLVRDLLPGLENLQRAIAAAEKAQAEKTQNVDELLQGVRLVAKQFEDILAAHSVVPIEAVDKPFDPNLHEAIQQQPSAEHPPLTVLHEVERGYTLHDRVVRPSRVIVSTAPDPGS